MAQGDKVFSGPIATVYDNVMGPIYFAPFAHDLAARVAALKPGTILETAAGSGIATEAMVAALPNAQVAATDLNQAMIDVARTKPHLAGVTWQACDATQLPFPDQSFDLVVCQFGAMFFPDKVVAYRDAHRVLKPGGHFVFNVWDTLATNPAPVVLLDALAKVFPSDPPSFLGRIPHGYNDVPQIIQHMETAGFRHVSATHVSLPCRSSSAEEMAAALCQGTPTRAEIETREPGGLNRVTAEVAKAFAAKFGSGAIETTMQAIVISGAA